MTVYTGIYQSAAGEILLSCDEEGLTGLAFRREDRGAFAGDGSNLRGDGGIFAGGGSNLSGDGSALAGEGHNLPGDRNNLHGNGEGEKEEHPVLCETRRWLDLYFSGKDPGFVPPLHLTGTPFRMQVWKLLLAVPYGRTTTYGELAKKAAGKMGLERMSAQAVGGAVGHNKIWIIVPCHRVLGADGSLTGYAGGIDKKALLLKLEGWNGGCLDGRINL